MNTRRMAAAFKKFSSCAALAGIGLVACTGLALAQNTISAGSVEGQAGQMAQVPITMSLAEGTNVAFFAATFTVTGQGGAPALTDKLTYAAMSPIPNPDLSTAIANQGKLAIGYASVTIEPAITGTTVVGTLSVPIPAGATSGSYTVNLSKVSAGDSDGNPVTVVAGPDGTITLPAPPGNTISAGNVNGSAGEMAAVPITMNLIGGSNVAFFAVTFTVTGQGGAPNLTDKLTYAAISPIPNPDLSTAIANQGKLAIGYASVTIDPPITGTTVVGNLSVPIPAGATSGSYTVNLSKVSAGDSDGNPVTLSAGPDGTITLGVVENTPTSTPTSTPTNTQGATPTVTNTAGAATPTPTKTPVVQKSPTPIPTQVAVLTEDITSEDSIIPVSDIDPFPPDLGKIQIGSEIITYTGTEATGGSSGSGGAAATEGILLNAIRGAAGTQPAAHAAGSAVLLFPSGGGGVPLPEDSDGCSIATNGRSNGAWLLVIPALGLLVMRRKSR